MSYSRNTAVDLTATDRNLWQAIVAEAIANLTYTAYAEKAREEGYPEIAEVFERVARAETQHGLSYLKVAGAVESTAANLSKVIDGETREYTRTYPRMINDAVRDDRAEAVAAFSDAMEQEKEHQMAFSDALARLSVRGDGGSVAALVGTDAAFEPVDAGPVPIRGERPALPLDLENYIDAALTLDREPFRVANLGRLREVVFGAQDGIISTVALTTSIAIAVGTTGTVLVAGLAAAAAGMISMAAGAYLGSRAEEDVREAAIARQVQELEQKPEEALAELVILFQREGNTYDDAVRLANQIADNDSLWLKHAAGKEAGYQPGPGGQSDQGCRRHVCLVRGYGHHPDHSLPVPHRGIDGDSAVHRPFPGRSLCSRPGQGKTGAEIPCPPRVGNPGYRGGVSGAGLRAGGGAYRDCWGSDTGRIMKRRLAIWTI